MQTILSVLWFFLPVGIANTAPIFAAHIGLLKNYTYPMDFYRTFRGKRIFGDHKTFRGLIAGVILAVITILLQEYLYQRFSFIRRISVIDYTEVRPFVFGFLCTAGALIGDALKSFFKRQVGVPPGKAWVPFDQIDYVIGGIIATSFYIRLHIVFYLLAIIVWVGMHVLSTYIGYILGLKESPI
jgi:CDP-2,3-bis-(O-geranylgeranyl)-sn-glycerol synthase